MHPVRRGGRWRKRWVYVAAFADEVMACAARVEIGPISQTFWAILDRQSRELTEHTRIRLRGARGEVRGGTGQMTIVAREAGGSMRVGPGKPVEVTCQTGEGGEVWTRKRAGVPVQCDLHAGERHWRLEALGVTDETSGFHPPHTVWNWSAGAGALADGTSVAWNLVEGINDLPQGSERAIWVDGEPSEPGPVTFDGLEGIVFDDRSRLDFTSEAERHRDESLLGVRYSYRQPFGSFTGTLPGGLELVRGAGVMEHHDAVW